MRSRCCGIVRSLLIISICTAAGTVAAEARAPHPIATLVLRDAPIVSMDPAVAPGAEALAIRRERILALGTSARILKYVGPATRVIDLHGAAVFPGFTDGHAHLLQLGEAKMALDLRGAHSWAEIVDMVAKAAQSTPPGGWILGEGWLQENWREAPQPQFEGMPTNKDLSRVAPNN